MTRSPVFRPAADKYLPLGAAALVAATILISTQLWGLAILREQFGALNRAQLLSQGEPFAFALRDFPTGPLWPLLLSWLAKSGLAIETAARFWQALVGGLLLFTLTRFYLRHLLSRGIVAGTALAAATGVLMLGGGFSLSPLLSAMLFATLGVLALARFLLEEEILSFLAAALCFGVATLLWIPALVLAIGAALAIVLGGRGNFARRFTGTLFFSAAAIAPAVFLLLQGAAPNSAGIFNGIVGATDGLSAWGMWSTWPVWLRLPLTLLVIFGLLMVYLLTRGPAGIGPALKRRELQVWILLSIVWTLGLLLFPQAATFLPILPALVLWPALGLDSFRDYTPISRELSGRGAEYAVWASALFLIIPLWQTGAQSVKQYQAGGGLRGFEWQTSELVQAVKSSASLPLYSDHPALANYILSRQIKPLPSDLTALDLLESRIVILGDSCPPGFCEAAETHSTLDITSALAARHGMLYDVSLRAQPALAASDSLTLP